MKNSKDKLKKLKQDIDAIKKSESIDEQEKPLGTMTKVSGMGFQIMIELFAGTFIGAAIGYFFDNLFDIKPFLFILFLMFGSVAGLLNAYHTAKIYESNNEK